jgi:hypothetical protein
MGGRAPLGIPTWAYLLGLAVALPTFWLLAVFGYVVLRAFYRFIVAPTPAKQAPRAVKAAAGPKRPVGM